MYLYKVFKTVTLPAEDVGFIFRFRNHACLGLGFIFPVLTGSLAYIIYVMSVIQMIADKFITIC